MAYGLSTSSSEVSWGQGGASMLDCLYCTSDLTTALYHLVKLLVGVVLVYTVLLQGREGRRGGGERGEGGGGGGGGGEWGRLVCVLTGVLSTVLLC